MTALETLAVECGASKLEINGIPPRYSFTSETLKAFAEVLMAAFEFVEIKPDGSAETPAVAPDVFDVTRYVLAPQAKAPARPQRVTPGSWTIVDANGKPMIHPKWETGLPKEDFNCLTSEGEAQAIVDLILWDANGTAPHFADTEKPIEPASNVVDNPAPPVL